MHVYVRGGPEIMASPGLAVPEEPHPGADPEIEEGGGHTYRVSLVRRA